MHNNEPNSLYHYIDVIMSAMVSQISSLATVYSTVYLRRRSKKTSKPRVTGLCAGNSPVLGGVDSPHKAPVTRKMFPFDDVVMSKNPISKDAWSNSSLLPRFIYWCNSNLIYHESLWNEKPDWHLGSHVIVKCTLHDTLRACGNTISDFM